MTEQDYPKLPLPMRINLTDGLPGRAVVEYYTADQMRDYADADRAQQSARHREELLAYEVTVGNLQAQVASDDVYISEILTREKNAAIADRQNYEVRVRLEADLEQLKAANLRAQLEQAQPVAHENCVPVACLVETDSGVMVWPIRNSAEACTYCDPDEIPQMLYLHPATPQAQPDGTDAMLESRCVLSSVPQAQSAPEDKP